MRQDDYMYIACSVCNTISVTSDPAWFDKPNSYI